MLLHLSLARPPFKLLAVQYQQLIGERQESLEIGGVDRFATVRLGATTEGWEPLDGATQFVDVGGRPGRFGKAPSAGGLLRWQMENGLWLQVYGARDAADALALAAVVRIDRTFRCVVPYRFGALPAGMTARTCSMHMNDTGVWGTVLGLSNGTFDVALYSGGGRPAAPNGQPVREQEGPGDGGTPTLGLAVDRGNSMYVDVVASGRYDKDVVRRMVSDLIWTDGNDPATWPTDPFTR
jgi:hypothetical protein